MNIEFIKKLALTMKEIDIKELEYSEKSGERVKLKRNIGYKGDFNDESNFSNYNNIDKCQSSYEKSNPIDYDEKYIDSQNNTALERKGAINIEDDKKSDDNNKMSIKSNMIGTFYSKASPDEESFVKSESKVKKGEVICIIESMKLMNEIKAPFDCEIIKCLVEDEEIVEFGQDLFEVRGFND